jgi:hypothetical protein
MPDATQVETTQQDKPMREDEALPEASEDKVLDETARLAREGRKQLDADPNENGSPR